LAFVPTVDEIVSIGSAHLQHAEDAMISFGQGCEGEPSLQWRTLVPAIQKIRERTLKGTINMNSNAGNTEAIRSLAQNGLDAIRVSLNSTRPELYHAYYRPVAYQFSHVLESMRACQENAVQLSFNLLAFPGITDREREVESLIKIIKEYGVRMVQLRNLNIDPILYWETMAVSNARDGKALGMLKLIEILQKETDVLVGSFSRSKNFLQN
jgi:pyruvate-formate lyase-activating enzyme